VATVPPVSKPPRQPIPVGIRILLGALLINAIGSTALLTILGKQVFDMTGREFDLGLLGLFEFLPKLIAAPIGGTLSDRYDRRKVMAVGLVVQLAGTLGLYAYIGTDPTAVGPIFALVAAFGIGRTVTAPASRSLPIDLSPVAIIERVVAVRSLAFQVGHIIGPVTAGFLFVVAIELPYLFAAVAFVVVSILIWVVPEAKIDQLNTPTGVLQVFRDAFAGLVFIRRNPFLRGAITLDLFAVLFGGAVALLPAIAEDRLGVGAIGLGWLNAAIGIGALMVAAGLSIRPIERRVGRRLLTAVALFGLMTIVLGLTRSYVVAFVALMALAGADVVSVFIRSTLVPLATPEAMRGRVLAVENVFIGASNQLGAVESGIAAHFLGLVVAVVAGGVATIGVVGASWRFFPELRDIDRFSDVTPGGLRSTE
jgi:MFS family permease